MPLETVIICLRVPDIFVRFFTFSAEILTFIAKKESFAGLPAR